ncbi:MAG: Cof-type HAD-IIB family hydrolase [Clostridia bacterium]|nr:Cof-type HAD-IIB family hydrolase [Clostridia bacterium]
MIRLVASDLDGTLLEKGGVLPDGIFPIILQLKEAGIAFAACSGRQYTNLRRLFRPVADKMMFICENGALCVRGDGSFDTTPIPACYTDAIMHDILAEGMNLLVSGTHSAYVMDRNRDFSDDIIYRLRNTVTVLHDTDELPEQPIKISGMIRADRMADVSGRLQAKWSGILSCVVAGPEWLDFTVADKGTGLKKLMNSLGIGPEDTAAFGDAFNDEPMLDLVGHPYIVQSAVPEMKKPRYTEFDKVLPVLESFLSGSD